MQKYFEISKEASIGDPSRYHPVCFIIFGIVNAWCYEKGIKPYWTSFFREPSDGSASDTHQTYRAGDLSLLFCFGWTSELRELFVTDMNDAIGDVGAIVYGENKLIYPHGEGKSYHAHIQIRRDIKTYFKKFAWPGKES